MGFIIIQTENMWEIQVVRMILAEYDGEEYSVWKSFSNMGNLLSKKGNRLNFLEVKSSFF